MPTTAKNAPQRGTGGLVAWPRPPRGPARVYPWIPSSSEAALANLEELPGERFLELVRALVPFQSEERERRHPLPRRLMLMARDRRREARELEHIAAALRTESCEPVVEGEPIAGDAVAQAHERLVAAAAALVIASGATRDQALHSEALQPGAVRWWEDVGMVLDDRLASAVCGLRWVDGTDLVQLAIWLGVEKPIRTDRGEPEGELERRRGRWDTRLRRARKLRDTPR